LSSGGADEDCPEVEEEEGGSPKGFPLPEDEVPDELELDGENEFAAPTALTFVGRNTAEIEVKSLNKSLEFLRN
jgi:hypothetical protein